MPTLRPAALVPPDVAAPPPGPPPPFTRLPPRATPPAAPERPSRPPRGCPPRFPAASTRGQRHGGDRHGRRELHHLTHNENSFRASGRTGMGSAAFEREDTAVERPARPEGLQRADR